jgi:molecular chaperone IbpA
MRTYDFSPLWRSTVGFDRLFDLINNTDLPDINNTDLPDIQDSYPPYDIVRTGRGKLPHFVRSCWLPARAHHRHGAAEPADGCRAQVRFRQAGIHLVRQVPEAMKPRRIEIGSGRQGRQEPGGRQLSRGPNQRGMRRFGRRLELPP